MKTLIIACKTLENELRHAMDECGCAHDVHWIESGLHNVPKKLTEALQDAIDASPGYDKALLAMGYCGNALAGLRSGGMTLTVARVDDCISLLLGSYKDRAALSKDGGTYFMTEGWLRGERNLWREYLYTIEKYGEEDGAEIFSVMLGNYKYLALLDTGCFDADRAGEEMKTIAETLNLAYKVIPATVGYLKRLLTGPWDDDAFLTIAPGSEIKEADLMLAI